MSILDSFKRALTPHQRRVIGAEAQQALDNRHWKEAFAAMDVYLTEQELSCDPDNKEKAQRIVISRQLMAGIHRELVRKIQDGEMAEVELEQIEQASKPRMFRR